MVQLRSATTQPSGSPDNSAVSFGIPSNGASLQNELRNWGIADNGQTSDSGSGFGFNVAPQTGGAETGGGLTDSSNTITLNLPSGARAWLTPEQAAAFQAASAVDAARANETAANNALSSWLEQHPSTSFDAPPAMRVPKALLNNLNQASQAVDDAEAAYNNQYANTETGFQYTGGDETKYGGGGKGVDAGIAAVNQLGRLNLNDGASSEIAPILMMVNPMMGVFSAGAASGVAVTNELAADEIPTLTSPFQVHTDPTSGTGPMALDTSTFTSGVQLANGGIRNARQFWDAWSNIFPDTLSEENLSLIKDSGISPVVDERWLETFPEQR